MTTLAAERKLLSIPPDPGVTQKLGKKYSNDALGDVEIKADASGGLVLDVGEWRSAFATKKNEDGTISLVSTSPGISGVELVVGEADGRKTLTVRDLQHEYVFREAK
jgi:hypothetical protein